MFTYKSGYGGTQGARSAGAQYLTREANAITLGTPGAYYLGEVGQHQETGWDALGRQILAGEQDFGEAVDRLVQAEMAAIPAGQDFDADAIQDRITTQVADAVTRADFAQFDQAGSEPGRAVAEIRPDMSPRMARTLGIDMNRRLTEREIGNLLGAMTADGQAIQGRAKHAATISVGEVFGLDGIPNRQKGIEATPPLGDAVTNILAGRRADGNLPRSADGRLLAPDVVDGAIGRFRAIYGLPTRGDIPDQQLAHMQAGRRANGLALNAAEYRRGVNDARERITYWDFTTSAPKSLSVAWGLATNEAERAILTGIVHDANQEAMRYLAERIGVVRRGRNGAGAEEKAEVPWVSFHHTTARPTVDLARTDRATGETYTDTIEVPLRHPDPLLHHHNAVSNVLLSEQSDHIGSLDGNRLKGEIKVAGAVYQAYVARHAREHGIAASFDPDTGSVRLDAIPKPVERHFSKRTEEGRHHAERLAAELKREGRISQDWGDMSSDQQAAFLKKETQKHRSAKNKSQDPTGDRIEWQRQANEIGYRHTGVLRAGPVAPELEPALRHDRAYRLGRELLDEAFQKQAVLPSDRVREIAARALITAGIGSDAEADIRAVTQAFYSRGVTLHGEETPLVLLRTVDNKGRDLWSATTGLKEAEETRLLDLARQASADRSMALTPAQIERAAEAYLARNPQIDREGPQWQAQRAMMEPMDAAALTIGVGAAGTGKTRSVLGPLADAWREDGRHVIGVALANRTAGDFAEAGITGQDRFSVAAFLHKVGDGRLTLDRKTVVLVDEVGMIGSRDLLSIVEATMSAGASLRLFGDPKQAQAVEAGDVFSLLEKALPGRIPELLVSVRQRAERDRETAEMWRQGRAGEAVKRKIEDGDLAVVAGGKDATIAGAVAAWQQRRAQHRGDEGYSLVVMTDTNEAARKLGLAIRQQQREMGDLGPDLVTRRAINNSRGSEAFDMPLAKGDVVRLYQQVYLPGRERRVLASNGEALTVLDASEAGLTVRNNRSGVAGTVPWRKLQDEPHAPVRLGYAAANTINLMQGVTATDAMTVLMDGTRGMDAYRAYVADSRHREASVMVIDEASVRRDIAAARPRGGDPTIRTADVIRRIGENLSRQPEKDNAIESIRNAHEVRRHAQRALRRADVPLPAPTAERASDLMLRVYNRQRLEITERIRHLGQMARDLSARLVHRHSHQIEREGPHLGLSR